MKKKNMGTMKNKKLEMTSRTAKNMKALEQKKK
jgi:hypothetical protein